jgi:hypothetical protein
VARPWIRIPTVRVEENCLATLQVRKRFEQADRKRIGCHDSRQYGSAPPLGSRSWKPNLGSRAELARGAVICAGSLMFGQSQDPGSALSTLVTIRRSRPKIAQKAGDRLRITAVGSRLMRLPLQGDVASASGGARNDDDGASYGYGVGRVTGIG